MAKHLIIRTASTVGLLALTLLFVGVDPFLSAGAGLTSAGAALTKTFAVDRSFKSDRLPVSVAPDWQAEFGALGTEPRAQMPFACDAAFSSISSSSSSNFYGRCMT